MGSQETSSCLTARLGIKSRIVCLSPRGIQIHIVPAIESRPARAASTSPFRSPRHNPSRHSCSHQLLPRSRGRATVSFQQTCRPFLQARPRLGLIRSRVVDLEAPCCRRCRAVSQVSHPRSRSHHACSLESMFKFLRLLLCTPRGRTKGSLAKTLHNRNIGGQRRLEGPGGKPPCPDMCMRQGIVS